MRSNSHQNSWEVSTRLWLAVRIPQPLSVIFLSLIKIREMYAPKRF